ncbi:DUF2637 domain-containing protein [Streptomyces sp. NPDC019208]|uniref:DUF2637 domain-containing protein n=1 Tax=Streptomyces sp. NPDC019208 TaxID=3154683 RepID=UPI0033C756DE
MNRTGKTLLVLALVAVVGMAFRVSWNALRDVARAIGADTTAATLYPFVVDGLMALALVATLVLVGRDRTFALRVLATYTLASLVLNYVHGLVPALHGRSVDWGRLADWDPANWALVLLATSLPVGAIYFGSDLVAKVLHHRPEPAATEPLCGVDGAETAPTPHAAAHRTGQPITSAVETPALTAPIETSGQTSGRADALRDTLPHGPHTSRTLGDETTEDALRRTQFEEAELERLRQDARRTYSESAQAGRPLSARALGEAYGMSESWGRKQILAVRDEEQPPAPPPLRAVDDFADTAVV